MTHIFFNQPNDCARLRAVVAGDITSR